MNHQDKASKERNIKTQEGTTKEGTKKKGTTNGMAEPKREETRNNADKKGDERKVEPQKKALKHAELKNAEKKKAAKKNAQKEKTEKKRAKRKYSRISCLSWAIRRLWQLDRNFMFFVLAGVPVAVIIPLVSSYFSKELIDRIGEGSSFSELTIVVVVFLGVIFFLHQFRFFMERKCQGRRHYPTSVFQTEMSDWEAIHMDYENIERQDFRKIAGYAWGDACQGNCAREFIWQDLSRGLIHLTGLVTYASLMILLNPLIFAVVVFTSLFTYFTTRWQPVYYEKNKHQWEKEVRKRDYLQGLSEDFSLAKDIKLYGLEEWLERMMRDYQAYIRMWNSRCRLRGLWAAVLSALMSFLQNGAAYVILIGILLDGKITVGEFVFYFGLTGSIGSYLQGVIGDGAQLNTRAEKISYYREFYDYPNRFNHGVGCDLPAVPVTIEFKDVWYRYEGAEEYTLKGINLVIKGGENLALVGMNGAGKTTLVKLICGMYTPTKGEILVGGRRIEEYNIEEYYSLISAVFQEIHMVAFTCLEFVTSADMERSGAREAAADAMKAAGIYDKVMGLPGGMDTHLMKGVYDDGVDFSGGELQKLVLARAIYKDGPILVLDEPTAALDPIAENNLYIQYKDLTRGKTSIYISHRFASTRFCDRILLLEEGIIAESGTHEELMEKQGRYAYMFETQSKYYKEGELHA